MSKAFAVSLACIFLILCLGYLSYFMSENERSSTPVKTKEDWQVDLDEFLKSSLTSPSWDSFRYDCLQMMVRKNS